MKPAKAARSPGTTLAVLLVAAVTWAALGYLALGAMYHFSGGSGHPPLPSAPNSVYVAVFVVALPLVGIATGLAALAAGRALVRRLG